MKYVVEKTINFSSKMLDEAYAAVKEHGTWSNYCVLARGLQEAGLVGAIVNGHSYRGQGFTSNVLNEKQHRLMTEFDEWTDEIGPKPKPRRLKFLLPA